MTDKLKFECIHFHLCGINTRTNDELVEQTEIASLEMLNCSFRASVAGLAGRAGGRQSTLDGDE